MKHETLLSVYLTVLAGIIVNTSAEQVPVISSNLTGRAACVGEDVTLTCEVFGTGRLAWVIGSDDNTIRFSLDDSPVYLGATMNDSTGQFSASLTNYTRDEQHNFLGNLTSELQTKIDPSLSEYPIRIFCRDGLTNNIAVPFLIGLAGVYATLRHIIYIFLCIYRGSLISTECDISCGVWCIRVFTKSQVGVSQG